MANSCSFSILVGFSRLVGFLISGGLFLVVFGNVLIFLQLSLTTEGAALQIWSCWHCQNQTAFLPLVG